MKKDKHGVNLFELQRKYNFDVDEVMDFSSNVNPIGPSKKALQYLRENLDQASVYPDPEYVDLLKEISNYTHANPEHILLGSGTTNLIKDFIHYVNPKRALLNSPCYSEYENELNLIGSEVFHYNLDYHRNFTVSVDEVIEIIQKNSIELYVITNPNNPTGTILNRVDIERIVEATNIPILIDETYIEFTDRSVYSCSAFAATNPNIFVVRSTSKFFATPGIRLGYAITSNQKVLDSMGKNFSLWGINIFAEMMGKVMFSDETYKAVTYNHIQREKDKMISALETVEQLKVFPSYGNFVLVKIKDRSATAKELREFLLPRKIVIRDCSNFKNLDERFFRFCILSKEANDLLIQGVYEFFGK
ncbi:aminotransferase class I/II-fold pyridoxal phosphate-dependent enzyme [Peptoniphilus sp. KCTC 25270]|uniref:pyridoxal phosphate-dependent aminotransferase n=1 Tax=Peptoniphilus sp. KCTC 25270 TaxID=2897414 RepID=UPI001E2AA983|nr:histidinol-phosphate transaminase [Peptoniphilus sp. KCTC 25270]MCD1147601.1 aminotransferase class I/II-fold pyridoxal phosphate-dependent enzyme [Peptoniphilus sp. KCTC 25270]